MAIGRPISLTPNIATKAISVVATASQTDFTVTGGYRINEIAVYRNGVRLAEGRDFTASDGSTVQLVTGAAVSDVIEFAVFDSFNVAGTIVSAASSQTVEGDLNITGRLYSGALVPNTFDVGIGTFQTSIHVGTAFTANAAGDIETVGIITAASFSGDGSALTNVGMDTANVVSTATTTTLLNVSGATDSTSVSTGALIVSGGVGIAKNVYIGAGLSVAGTLTYEDVTSVDSVGLITAKSGVNITGGQLTIGSGITMGIAGVATFSGTSDVHLLDNVKLNVGDGSDLSIYHQGTHSFIEDSGTGSLKIRGSVIELSDTGADQMLVATENSSVNLYNNGVKTFETTAYGAMVTDDDASAELRFTSSSGQVGSVWGNSDTTFGLLDGQGHSLVIGTKDAEVSLYYDNFRTFKTNANGIDVYGPEGGAAQVVINADESDDDADQWRLLSNTDGNFRIDSYASGSWAEQVSVTSAGAVTATKFLGDGSALTGVGGEFDITSCLFV